MDFLIFVGEVIWALAGFLDLLQKNPLADFLMGEFLNPSSHLNPLHITPHSERVVRAHGGLGDRRWAWLVSSTRCIGLGPCVKCSLGLRYQPARALQWTYRQEV